MAFASYCAMLSSIRSNNNTRQLKIIPPMKTFRLVFMLAAAIQFPALISSAQSLMVFTNSFDGVMPAEIQPGSATLTGVQGYAGLGPVGNQFGGAFLRCPTGTNVILTLSNLPPHQYLHLAMLFAAIDSLDGTGSYPSGDFFTVRVDTNVVFRESFANATESQIQSYVAPPGAQLARRVDLGFSGPGSYYTDSAYNFGVDPRFINLAHTGAVATLSFEIEGPGIQSLDDESWAVDNLSVSVSTEIIPPVIQAIRLTGTNVSVTWFTTSNRVYQVQSKTNLSDVTWNDLSPLITATNWTASFIEPRISGSKFYRVKLLLP